MNAVPPFGLAVAVFLAASGPGLLSDDAHLFGYIAETTHLGKADDADLVRRLNSNSSMDRLHDYSGESILVVKVELLGDDASSRVRSPEGNYPFFVFRDTGHGYLLLGQMDGRAYEWSIPNRHLQFRMSTAAAGQKTAAVRYEVNQAYLVNLTELAQSERRHERFVADLSHAF